MPRAIARSKTSENGVVELGPGRAAVVGDQQRRRSAYAPNANPSAASMKRIVSSGPALAERPDAVPAVARVGRCRRSRRCARARIRAAARRSWPTVPARCSTPPGAVPGATDGFVAVGVVDRPVVVEAVALGDVAVVVVVALPSRSSSSRRARRCRSRVASAHSDSVSTRFTEASLASRSRRRRSVMSISPSITKPCVVVVNPRSVTFACSERPDALPRRAAVGGTPQFAARRRAPQCRGRRCHRPERGA